MTQGRTDSPIVNSETASIPELKKFSHNAMASFFEIFILHKDALYAQQAAYAAFNELDKLEQELSRYIENSDISRINNLLPNQSLKIAIPTFESLELCQKMYIETVGVFDVTVGSLKDCWLGKDKTPLKPTKKQLDYARAHTGSKLYKLDHSAHSVEVLTDNLQIDLGGFAKGYAVDKMAELLLDWNINTALINGGYSSVLALGTPPQKKGWPVTLSHPQNPRQILAYCYLKDNTLSGSGLEKGPHIIDPRTGQPVKNKIAAWSCAKTASVADALSTAFMVMSEEEIKQYCQTHPDISAAVIIGKQTSKNPSKKNLFYGNWENKDSLPA